MPVKRFRSVEEIPAMPTRPFDPDNLRIAIELSGLCAGLSRRRFRPGVTKFHSLAEMHEAEDR